MGQCRAKSRLLSAVLWIADRPGCYRLSCAGALLLNVPIWQRCHRGYKQCYQPRGRHALAIALVMMRTAVLCLSCTMGMIPGHHTTAWCPLSGCLLQQGHVSLFLFLYLLSFFAVGSWPVRYFILVFFIPSVTPAMVVQLSMYGLAMSGSVLFMAC